MKKYYQYNITVLVLFCIPGYVFGLNQLLLYNQEDKYFVTKCVIKLMEDINYKQYISIMNPNNLLDLSLLHQIKGMIHVTRSFCWQRNTLHTNVYIITAATYEELETGLNLAKNNYYWNPRANFLIIVEHLKNDLNNIARFLLDNNIFRVLILIKNENGYHIYTFRSNFCHCNRSEILVLVSPCFNNNSKPTFPVLNKHNFRNCQFKIYFRSVWPYFNWDKSNGIEYKVLRLFEKVMGIKLIFVERYVNRSSGVISGIPDGLGNNEFEGAAGGYALSLKSTSRYDYSYPVWVDRLQVIIHRADYLDLWFALCGGNLLPFSVLFIIFFVFCALTIRLPLFPWQKMDVVRDVIIILGYFLNKTTVRRINKGISQKITFSTLLFLALLLPYIIQGHLYTLITNPVRGYEEKNARKIYSGFKLIIHDDWPEEDDRLFVQHCCVKDCLQRIKNKKEERLYTILSDVHVLAYAWMLLDDQCNSVVYTLIDPSTTMRHTMYFRRGSLLRVPFDKFTLKLTDSGLIRKIAVDVLFANYFKCKPKNKERDLTRNMGDIKVAFIVLLVGYFICAIVFIFEFWVIKRQFFLHNLNS